jgi:anti-anti-sigma factor
MSTEPADSATEARETTAAADRTALAVDAAATLSAPAGNAGSGWAPAASGAADDDYFTLVTARPRADAITITVRGPLDYETSDDLLTAVTEELNTPPAAAVLSLDLAGLTVCDSMGLAALLTIRRRTAAGGLPLRLLHRPDTLDRLLDLTGTTEYLLGGEHDGPGEHGGS